MEENKCPQCGAPIEPMAEECRFCGEKLAVQQVEQRTFATGSAPQPQVVIQQAPSRQEYPGVSSSWPIKSKIVAGILGILLGGLGIHKFYLGKTGMGILYLVFCWTCIPSIIGFIEGVIYLCSSDENFQLKHHVRIQ